MPNVWNIYSVGKKMLGWFSRNLASIAYTDSLRYSHDSFLFKELALKFSGKLSKWYKT